MKFVDASVFVHAFIKPKRELKPHEVKIKQAAQKIVKRINEEKKWREKYLKDGIVLMKIEGEKIIIEPSKKIDLTKFFDSIEVNIQSDLSEWKRVKRELYEVR